MVLFGGLRTFYNAQVLSKRNSLYYKRGLFCYFSILFGIAGLGYALKEYVLFSSKYINSDFYQYSIVLYGHLWNDF